MNTIRHLEGPSHPSSLESPATPPAEAPGSVGVALLSLGPIWTLWPIWLTLLIAPVIVLAAPGLVLVAAVFAIFVLPYLLVRHLRGERDG